MGDIKTKFNAGVMVLLLLIVGIMNVFALTRTISDTGDSVDTFIRNSDGEYWAAIGANIEVAYIATSSPGWVKIPPGIFSINDDIQLISGISLYGSGIYITTIQEVAGGTSTNGLLEGSSDNNITLSDFTLDVNGDAATTNNGIDLDGCADITIDNIRVFDPDWNCIRTWATTGYAYRINIQNCFMSGVKSTYHNIAYVDTKYGYINNIVCTGHSGTGKLLDLNGANNMTVSNIVGYGIPAFIKITGGSSNISLNNLHVIGNGVETEECIDFDRCNAIQISNLHITGPGFIRGLYFDSVSHNIQLDNIRIENISGYDGILNYANYVTFSNLVIRDCTRYGISNNGDHVTVTNFDISNCDITSNGAIATISTNDVKFVHGRIYNILGSGAYAINLNGATNTSIIDIDISNIASNGIYGKNGRNAIISDCFIHDCIGDGIDFVTATAMHNFTIVNCFFMNNAKAIDISSSSNYFLVDNCICNSDDIDINAALSYYRRVNDTICSLTVS